VELRADAAHEPEEACSFFGVSIIGALLAVLKVRVGFFAFLTLEKEGKLIQSTILTEV
jgi:hypothetical protein